ncbi:MAG: twin-arginine translocase TatA/TatE family subunit [Acidimicrobiia bacterium]|nr:twin-arginine translocase TatA/TatE family subunit [Acidimicrobiia bacterium]MBV8986551.1 twin-arginine translocase TatA/TatE family subunit [Acidimicrobiia bacterium]
MPAGLTSPMHVLVIIVVALVVLGPERLPHALRQVGRTMGELRRWSDTISSEMRGVLSLELDDPAPAATSTPAPAPTQSVPSFNGASGPVPPPAPTAAGLSLPTGPLHQALQQGGEWH